MSRDTVHDEHAGYFKDISSAAASLIQFEILVDDIRRLQTAAVDQLKRSYIPYSKFPVGAALLFKGSDDKNVIIPGCNVENAAYGPSLCAERNAIGAAIALGHNPHTPEEDGQPVGDFLAVCVAAPTPDPCTPCGMCRQVLREFCSLSTPIVMVYGPEKDKFFIRTLEELLPHSFGPSALGQV